MGLTLDAVTDFFQCTQSFQQHHGSRTYSARNRNEYQKIPEGKTWPACKADNLTAICEPGQCQILNISQPHRPPWPVAGRALLFSCVAFIVLSLDDKVHVCISITATTQI
jgi:hypothetical protein